jgi:hypothetical protein
VIDLLVVVNDQTALRFAPLKILKAKPEFMFSKQYLIIPI